MVHSCLLDLFNFYEFKAPFLFLLLLLLYIQIHICCIHRMGGFFFLPWLEVVKIFCSNSVIFFSISMIQFLQKLGYGKKLYIETSFRGLKWFGIQDDCVKDELITFCIYFLVALISLYALHSLYSQNSAQSFVDLEQLCIMTIIFSLLSEALP